ncbi:14856_t:CDS:2, partial [Acaulospora morrowiae]
MLQEKLPYKMYIGSEVPSKPSPNWTRFVCVSDTHNTVNSENFHLPDGDILLHAGDLTKNGALSQIESVVDWLKSLPHGRKIIIAGNHETCLDIPFYQHNWRRFHTQKQNSVKALEIIRNAACGIVYLEDESFTIPENGYNIYGSPYSP